MIHMSSIELYLYVFKILFLFIEVYVAHSPSVYIFYLGTDICTRTDKQNYNFKNI
jgi:hypothetical protein